jgi:cell division protein FtsQ
MDTDAYPREVLADEEPKYLRRQKPLEIKRRTFGRQAWRGYWRVTVWVVAGIATSALAYESARFVLYAPKLQLLHPEQIEIANAHYVQRAAIVGIFSADRNRSILRIPLDQRRRQIELISWVESAEVRRALPNKIEIEITERRPIAFLRQGNDTSLVDLHGVILSRPAKASFHFPVVSGVGADMPLDEREKRMRMFAGFMQQVESAQAGAAEQVSEVDLADANDLRAILTGVQLDAPLLVHFGDGGFQNKYRTLLDNIAAYRAKAGRLESLDMRFSGEVVANPDTSAGAQQVAQKSTPAPPVVPTHGAKKSTAKRLR